MKRTHFYNLIAGLALGMFSATGYAAELLSLYGSELLQTEVDKIIVADQKLTTELKIDAAVGTLFEPSEVTVIVRYKNKPDLLEVSRLTTLDATTKRAYSQLPMRAIRIPSDQLVSLVNDENVEFVTQDAPVLGFTAAARLTANEPLNNSGAPAFNGMGVGVAVIDSGVNGHDDIYASSIEQYSFLNGVNGVETALVDDFGHGTHVSGIITGDGGESANKVNRGLAPKADLISLQVLDNTGRGEVSDVIAALDWVLQNAVSKDIHVVNMSLGKAVETEAANDPLVQAAEAVWDAGITVVVSAGNYGRDGHFTITSPGNSRKVITVGSITDNETGTDLTDDFVSTYSSRGPTMHDHILKPDLLAPGNRVVAPIPDVAGLRTDLADRVVACDPKKIS